jgi:hypothetical protein
MYPNRPETEKRHHTNTKMNIPKDMTILHIHFEFQQDTDKPHIHSVDIQTGYRLYECSRHCIEAIGRSLSLSTTLYYGR